MEPYQDNGVGLQFAMAIETALEAGQPMAHEVSELVDRLSVDQLRGWVRNLEINDKLLLQAEVFQKHMGRARQFRPTRAVSMSAAYRQKRVGRKSRPSALSVAGMIRMQNEYLTSALSPGARARIMHQVEVATCPAVVKQDLVNLVGMAFTTSATSVNLPQGFVPAKGVFTQSVAMGLRLAEASAEAPPHPRIVPYAILREHEGLYLSQGEEYGVGLPSAGTWYDFDADLSRGSGGLLISQEATIENGHAIHRAMADAILSGRPLPRDFEMPRGYIKVSADHPHELNWHPGHPVPVSLEAAVMARLTTFWEKGGHVESCRSTTPGYANPDHWLSEVKRLNLIAKIPVAMPLSEIEQVLNRHGTHEFTDLLFAVFLSEIREFEGSHFFPIDLFAVTERMPFHPRSELFIEFGPSHFGRDCYTNLTRTSAPQAGSVQVVYVGD